MVLRWGCRVAQGTPKDRVSSPCVCSMQELVGHCVALYQHNHAAIAQLEQRLQQYGYRDVYAPLPPENPLDMLMLRAQGRSCCFYWTSLASPASCLPSPLQTLLD